MVVLSGAVAAAVMPEWRERASQSAPVPGGQFLDALQILRVLWEAHHAGNTVSVQRLHGIVKLSMDRIESLLDSMSAARWVGQVAQGWTLTKDAGEIAVADVYHHFVFRADARLPSRQSGHELDRLAAELAGSIDDHLKISLEDLFRRAAGDQRPGANVLRLG